MYEFDEPKDDEIRTGPLSHLLYLSRMQFVDLAGTDTLQNNKADAKSDKVAETQAINESVFAISKYKLSKCCNCFIILFNYYEVTSVVLFSN